MCLFFAIEFLIAWCGALFPVQSSLNAVFHHGLSGPLHRHATDMKRLLNLLIGPCGSLRTLIGLQQNPGARQFVGRSFTFRKRPEGLVVPQWLR